LIGSDTKMSWMPTVCDRIDSAIKKHGADNALRSTIMCQLIVGLQWR
jgi:hypothetical protein